MACICTLPPWDPKERLRNKCYIYEKPPEPKPEPKPDPTVEKVTESEPKNPETVHTMDDLKASFTMDDLKASLTALAKSKGAKAPKEFLQSRGYSKLSEVPESEIDSLMAEVA